MLDRRQRLQRRLPVGTSGAETGGLGTGGGLWTFPAGTLIPAPVPVVAITTTPAATSIVAISTAAASAASSTSVVTVAASTTTLGREHLGDQWFFAAAPEQCKGLGLLAGRLRRKDRRDGQAVEISVGLDLQHVTNRSARGKQTPVECALGLLGPSRAPVPLAIATVGGEFDVKPACHGRKRYRPGASAATPCRNDQAMSGRGPRSLGSTFPPQTMMATRSSGAGT